MKVEIKIYKLGYKAVIKTGSSSVEFPTTPKQLKELSQSILEQIRSINKFNNKR